MDDIARNPGHVRKEGGSGEDDRVVSNKGRKGVEEGIKIEKQTTAVVTTPFEDPEGQVPNKSGGIKGNGDVGQ